MNVVPLNAKDHADITEEHNNRAESNNQRSLISKTLAAELTVLQAEKRHTVI